MNKKVVVGIIVAVIVTIVGGVIAFVLLQPKTNPEEIWQSYISLINEQKY